MTHIKMSLISLKDSGDIDKRFASLFSKYSFMQYYAKLSAVVYCHKAAHLRYLRGCCLHLSTKTKKYIYLEKHN